MPATCACGRQTSAGAFDDQLSLELGEAGEDREDQPAVGDGGIDRCPCYKSFAFREACKALGLRHIRTKPYTSKTNSKAERFIQTALREWAYAQAYPTSDQRAAELPTWLHRYNWHRPHGGIKSQTPISHIGLDRDNLLRLHS